MNNNLKGQRKNLRKLIGLVSKDDGEAAFRAYMARLPVTIDETKMKSRNEFLVDLRSELQDLEVTQAVELCEKRYGSAGLKKLRDESKAKLSQLGLDPDA